MSVSETSLNTIKDRVYAAINKISIIPQAHNRKLKKTNPLVIRADKRVDHGKVVQIMDLAKGAGIERLAIGTQVKH